MFGVFLLFLALFLASFNFIQKIWLKYILVISFLALFCLPLYQKNHSVINLWYSFFDAPCILSILLLLCFILRKMLKDFHTGLKITHFLEQNALNLAFCVVVFVLGLILFLGELNLIGFDLYHSSLMYQGMIVFIFVMILYLIKPFYGILALLSLVFMIGEKTAFDVLIDVYLWLFSLIFLVLKGLNKIKLRLRK
ncbi:hypothetical protein DMB92_02030 [Campylobacter sp. MIT 99-7217]|uniref:hypothetical protein n=1 Tax=Campylobacter sp. MIT 99-7217 TaxID=535091 RepID=UPI001158EEF2|nr:hypothetical protein [Campylobacter sp. MIT 99-7217]TQR33688.1 hypothetical protein DMB92_02030 [Campylobacter sp. MIT 99-7217]